MTKFFAGKFGKTGVLKEEVYAAVAELNTVLEFAEPFVADDSMSPDDIYDEVKEDGIPEIKEDDEFSDATKNVLFLVWGYKHNAPEEPQEAPPVPEKKKDKKEAATGKDKKSDKKADKKKEAPAKEPEIPGAVAEPEAVVSEVKEADQKRKENDDKMRQIAPLDGRSSPNRLKYSRMDAVPELLAQGITDVDDLTYKADELYAKKTQSKKNAKEAATQVRRILNTLLCYGAISISPDWTTVTTIVPPRLRNTKV